MLNHGDFKASFKVRLLQFFIDLAIINLLLYLTFHFFPSGLNKNQFVVSVVSITLYFFVLELIFSKTIGMMIMNIEIIYIHSDERIDYIQALLRTLGRVICTCTLGIGYALELHDYISETNVIINMNSSSPTPGWVVFFLKHARRLRNVRPKG